MSNSALIIFDIISSQCFFNHLTLCPIRRLFYSTLLPVNIFYFLTISPILICYIVERGDGSIDSTSLFWITYELI
jgi:hypothetical protein